MALLIGWTTKNQRTIDVARVTRIRSDGRAPECQCWHGFPGNARIARQIEKTFSRNCHTGSTDSSGRHKKSFQKMLCIRAFCPQSMPCKHFRRTPLRALPCAVVRPAPESHILPRHSCSTGTPQTSERRATWALLGAVSGLPYGTLHGCETPRNEREKKNI